MRYAMTRLAYILLLLLALVSPVHAGGFFRGDLNSIATPLDLQYSSVLFERFSVDASGALNVEATEKAPEASTAALAGLGAGSVNSGTHSYKITFVTGSGETDAGAVSGTVTTTAGNGQVALSAIPTGSHYVLWRKIYRTAAGNAVTGPWLLLAPVTDNTTTTYADNIADASLTTAIPTVNTAIDVRLTLYNRGGLNITTGNSENTALGANALSVFTTGVRNTAIGSYAIQAITTGAQNTALGAEAGLYTSVGTDNITSSSSLYLGYDTQSSVDGNTNEIVIGTSAVGLGSNTVVLGNSSIVTTALRGNVGIGTDNPTEKLRISNGMIMLDSNYGMYWDGAGSYRTGRENSPIGAQIVTSSALVEKVWNGVADGFLIKNSINTSLFEIAGDGSKMYIAAGNVGIGTTSPASLLDLRAGDLTMSGANGQAWVLGRKTELTTIAAAATTTTTITIPANAILKAVMMRVTVAPPGTATAVVTATTSGTVLQTGASMATTINTTDTGIRAWGTNYNGVAAQTITITPNATPSDATGRVRFDIYYEEPTVATS